MPARPARLSTPTCLVLCAALLLTACASRRPADGPSSRSPQEFATLPDATPRVEPLRVGGPNKPYEVLGERYAPMAHDGPLRERGLASWYGRAFHGRPTANGEVFDMHAMTAAHKTMPLPSYARVTNPANGREIVVRVNDRGPFHPGRIIDLSYAAAAKLGVLGGVTPVEVERLTHDMIRAEAGDAQPVQFWLQLGAFRDAEGAAQLARLVRSEAHWIATHLSVTDQPPWFRVRAGPWADHAEAASMALRLADSLPLEALIVRAP